MEYFQFFLPILRSCVIVMIPLLFASAGGMFTALTGNLNIALEGLLIAGAFSALALFRLTGNIFLSILGAIIFTVILSAIHAFSVFKLKANIFISGLALNLLSSGLCAVLSVRLFNTRGVISIQNISSSHIWYLISALFLLVLSWIFIYKTPYGFRLRSCDKESEALESLGIKTSRYKIFSILLSGFFCALGGAFLSLNLGSFVPGMSAGKGWIALVIIFLGRRKPQGILAASFIFALIEVFSHRAQGFMNIPADFILAFPYVFMLAAMIIVSFIRAERSIRR